ncbi:MAG: MoaD/ThiS family protein [Nanoarchaeota archaeon]|nr:MoaD/ThiS family protein [Nanoarchaeota archaeon]MBU1644674.1 MoaD/ThiS family protein [Nanoarchaeota archaeon]MBU1976569.1 MoaD/ThiS family protein [Nanoarchaeota archaeon]
MNLEIFDERANTTKKVQTDSITVKDLLLQLNINFETVLITRNNEVLTEDETLNDNDCLEILSVISGG